jgi:hypothetical protein
MFIDCHATFGKAYAPWGAVELDRVVGGHGAYRLQGKDPVEVGAGTRQECTAGLRGRYRQVAVVAGQKVVMEVGIGSIIAADAV